MEGRHTLLRGVGLLWTAGNSWMTLAAPVSLPAWPQLGLWGRVA